MTRRNDWLVICALVALAVCGWQSKNAAAAGFAIKEQSSTALGNAFAGATSGVDDISYMFFNPAGLVYHKGVQGAVSISYVAPSAEFQGGQASVIAAAGGAAIVPTADFTGNDDIASNALVPATYALFSLSDDLKLGLAITAPFGLVTKNPDGWIGRYHAIKSELTTIDINPTVAYRPIPGISIGAGFRAVYADTTLSNAVDFGTIGVAAGGVPGTQDGFAEVEGDDWGYGWNIGIMAEPLDHLRVGVAYRSAVKLKVRGNADFTDDTGGFVNTIRTAQADPSLFTDTGATAKVELPETLAIGANYDVSDRLSLMADAVWTGWGGFNELRIQFDNPSQSDSVTTENWDDSWFFAVGATYRPAFLDGLKLRLGLAFDDSPVPDSTRTPRIPGEDRYWVAVGGTYAPYKWLELNLSYTHIFVSTASIDLTTASDPNNAARGNLKGEFEGDIDIVTVQGTVRF